MNHRILGNLLLMFSITMLPPLFLALWYQEHTGNAFLISWIVIGATGYLLRQLKRRTPVRELRLQDGFIVIVASWILLGLFGALPLLLADIPGLSFTHSVFESFSGLTTTGATVLQGVHELPKSILIYRQLLQWLGGLGIIVIAVAILPMLGVGGLQLYRARLPSPTGDTRLAPRIAQSSKLLWSLYLLLTLCCTICYYLAGMSLFDALSHSFSTVSIGGFSTYDNGLSHFEGNTIKLIASVFMLLSGINFALHFTVFRNLDLRSYLLDPECRVYLWLHLCICVLCCLYLIGTGYSDAELQTFTNVIFQAISIATTTGFTLSEYPQWPVFLTLVLLFASFIGACSGSVGGGIKLIRVVLLTKQGAREILRLIHPTAALPIKIGDRPLPARIIEAIWGFFSLYMLTFAILMLALLATGLDQVTAFSAVAACLNNLGPGLGEVSSHYANINEPAKWLLIAAMLLGRLEIITILTLFTFTFWKK